MGSQQKYTPVIQDNGSTKTYTYSYTVTEDTVFYGTIGDWDKNACSVNLSFVQPKPEGTLVDTVTLSPDNNWQHTFMGLPKTAQDSDGNTLGEYSYYVEEVDGAQYSVVYKDLTGNYVGGGTPVKKGTILVQNTITEEIFALPETGGMGSQWYIFGGILLMAGALLWYRKQDKGKEGTRTS